jgi:hypothetical protein
MKMTSTKRIVAFLFCAMPLVFVVCAANMLNANVLASNYQSPQRQQPEGGSPITYTMSITLTPGIASSLLYTDTQGLPTQLDFPANTAIQTTTINFAAALWTSPDPNLIFAQHAFVLVASRDGAVDLNFTFSAPVTVTISYSDADIQTAADESRLTVYWWTGHGWRDAAYGCNPTSSYYRNLTANIISVPICDVHQFGLYSTHQIYLPLIAR